MIHFNWHPFAQLSLEQLYDLLALRAQVFVVDQQSLYLDLDGKDKFALHLLGVAESNLSAYLRLFPPTQQECHVIFGRVLTATSARGKGYGKQLMQALLNYCDTHFPNIPIKCSAQAYLQKFYEEFGFCTKGEVYHEDGIPHIAMLKQ